MVASSWRGWGWGLWVLPSTRSPQARDRDRDMRRGKDEDRNRTGWRFLKLVAPFLIGRENEGNQLFFRGLDSIYASTPSPPLQPGGHYGPVLAKSRNFGCRPCDKHPGLPHGTCVGAQNRPSLSTCATGFAAPFTRPPFTGFLFLKMTLAQKSGVAQPDAWPRKARHQSRPAGIREPAPSQAAERLPHACMVFLRSFFFNVCVCVSEQSHPPFVAFAEDVEVCNARERRSSSLDPPRG